MARISKREALNGLPDLAGPVAAMTVGEILGAVVRYQPDRKFPPTALKFADVTIADYLQLPPSVISFLIEWFKAQQFCPGPPADYAYLFHTAPNLHALYPASFRPEFGPVFYRGRLDGTARLLIIGQDPSTDEQLANRAFVGFSGQRLQRFLEKVGLDRSYIMINTFHLGVQQGIDLDVPNADPAVFGWRNQLLDRLVASNPIEAVLTVGSPARRAIRNYWPGSSAFLRPSRIVDIWHPSAVNFDATRTLNSWNSGLTRLASLIATPDKPLVRAPQPYNVNGFGPSDDIPVPRRDLPFGTPSWHGAGGQTRSHRPTASEVLWTSP